MWASSSATAAAARHVNCGIPPEFFFVAPASFQHQQNPEAGAAAAGFDPQPLSVSSAMVGVIPLLTATPCLAPSGIAAGDEDLLSGTRGASAMQLWQNPPGPNPSSSSAYLIKPMALENSGLLHAGGGASTSNVVGRPSPSLGGATTCQDCGNQAKKDCSHRRCRTCCKSRGYYCATHVKSTWVPAARRRERQIMVGTAAGSSQSTSGTKKPRLGGASQTTTTASHTSTSNTTPRRSFETGSSHQDASFKESLPGQVRAPAVFKCVKVTTVDDGEDEYAYQAVVKIGGHIFKGFLYDQGVEGGDALPNLSELHLGGGRTGATSSLPVNLDPSDHIYAAASGGGLLGGSSYGNPIN